jgi:hypothetical protein
MLHENLPMGSPAWVESIFNSPPVRKLKGHSKHTQYHQTFVESMGRLMGAQGATEASALMVLEYLTLRNQIRRFKEQPFRTTLAEFDNQIVPDFLAEGRHGELFILEMKTSRFLTRLKQSQLDLNKEKFARFGMTYLVWTDLHPLAHPVRHNLRHMRQYGYNVPDSDTHTLELHIKERHSVKVKDLCAAGFDWGCVFAAAWKAQVFFPITKPFSLDTVISCAPAEDLGAIFLQLSAEPNGWWSSLQAV